MPLITHYLPELEETERFYIQDLIEQMSHAQAQLFATAYRERRKDPHTVLLTAIVGLVAIPGLQRFWLGQIGMGFLYLFTWGLLLVGTISDLVRYKKLAFTYNQIVARQIAANLPLREGKPPSSIGESAFLSNRGFVSQRNHA
ncbi:MAG: TM2 domain-containing protein [Acidobacteriota bacterium]|nr:TM2 domain-containing protein [Acidobacteriota bacterium]